MTKGRKATCDDFLRKAREKHGERYNYRLVRAMFVTFASYVNIICSIHGVFKQQASVHVHKGAGCSKCTKKPFQPSNTATFVKKAKDLHSGFYDYSRVSYTKNSVSVEIGCPQHGWFWQRPATHLLGHGCRECAKVLMGQANARTQDEFLKLAKEVHENIYAYDHVVYVQQYQEVTIICRTHGPFVQLPKLHLKGAGCPSCGLERSAQKIIASAAAAFADKANEVHASKYDYSLAEYQNQQDHVTVLCPEHGAFQVRPSKHLGGQGCPVCSGYQGFSHAACDWLDYVAEQEGISITHGRNGEEFRIPGTNYRADGYCEQTGELFEFLGDYYHGNPAIYAPDFYNKSVKATMGELYEKTMQREAKIRELGWSVRSIWEQEWSNIKRQMSSCQYGAQSNMS